MTIAASLPARLLPGWTDIEAGERRLAEALEAGDYAALEPIAARRHAMIVSFFAELSEEPGSEPVRLELLQALIARNEALLGDSRARLATVAGSSVQAQRNRRALEAYGDQRA